MCTALDTSFRTRVTCFRIIFNANWHMAYSVWYII